MKTYTIGRDLGCDIIINDNTDVVSRRHAVLTVGPGGKMTITDLSSNGTYVNGIKIAPNVPFPVSRKDSVSFAHVANLDWNMIPKQKGWLKWFVIALCIVVLGALGTIWLLRDRPLPPNNDNPVVTDSIDMVTDSIPTDTITVDTVKMDTTKPIEKPGKKAKHQKEEKPEPQPEPEQKTDSAKPAPRPIGV